MHYDGVYHIHWVDFPCSASPLVSVPQRSAFETSRRELSEDVSFGIGTLLVAEQSSLILPQACHIHRRRIVLYQVPGSLYQETTSRVVVSANVTGAAS